MRHPLLPALFSAALLSQAASAQSNSSSFFSGWRPYAELQAWEASDAVAVTKFDSDWSTGFSPRDGSNTSLQRLRAGLGMEKGGWSIGWELRQEASLVADRQTLEMVRLYKQRQDPAPGSRFDAQARFESWSAQGLRVAHAFDAPAIAGRTPRVKVSAAAYTRPQLRDNTVSGSVVYSQSGVYSFNAAQTDAYSRYRYPFMQHEPNASGASLSLLMDLPLSQSLSLRLQFDDLWSRIRWSNLPVMQRTINSDVTDRDSNGYVNYRPTLSGLNRQIDENFAIPRSTIAALSYRRDAWGAAAQIERWSGVSIPTLSVTRYFGWGHVTANVETRFHSVGLGVTWGKFRLSAQSDSLHPDQAKALGLQISYCTANE
ncbi:MAG: hypothetical protein ACM3WS_05605 [Bacillota bacterium]